MNRATVLSAVCSWRSSVTQQLVVVCHLVEQRSSHILSCRLAEQLLLLHSISSTALCSAHIVLRCALVCAVFNVMTYYLQAIH
eukprot:5191-Heterococcus_DN1.PRE.5